MTTFGEKEALNSSVYNNWNKKNAAAIEEPINMVKTIPPLKMKKLDDSAKGYGEYIKSTNPEGACDCDTSTLAYHASMPITI